MAPDTRAVIFDFDGLMIDSESVEADCIIEALPADACLVLEDSVPGCEAALAAGMRVIACPSVVTAHGCSTSYGDDPDP